MSSFDGLECKLCGLKLEPPFLIKYGNFYCEDKCMNTDLHLAKRSVEDCNNIIEKLTIRKKKLIEQYYLN